MCDLKAAIQINFRQHRFEMNTDPVPAGLAKGAFHERFWHIKANAKGAFHAK